MDHLSAQRLMKGKLYWLEMTYSRPRDHVLIGYKEPELGDEEFDDPNSPNVLAKIPHKSVLMFIQFKNDSSGLWCQALYQDQVIWFFAENPELHRLESDE